MFVIALQTMREKCLLVAFFLSMKNNEGKENLYAEISESLGTMYYSDTSFSLRKLTAFEVRKRTKLAQSFFQTALTSIIETEEVDDLAEYELQFMIGKVR